MSSFQDDTDKKQPPRLVYGIFQEEIATLPDLQLVKVNETVSVALAPRKGLQNGWCSDSW